MKKQILILTLSLILSFISYSQETYKIGKTEYYSGQYYSTTGKPLVKRSESNKKAFLKSLGYNKTPKGYEIDHIKPLSEGGTDDPSNMRLITIEQHDKKTARESTNRSNTTYYKPNTYTSNSTYNSLSKKNSSTSTNYSPSKSSSKTIQTGPRGGKYYINKNGKKTYVKKK